ncbi:hypothetical protein BKA61DRAFT_581143 [Leptodontidium sp. MPI-SDFR-AT-0119]|nr:hypothetical protein BKA61DRAFT_581143 [Leptodontidium sp. MPI-SDFR-AT-0119]
MSNYTGMMKMMAKQEDGSYMLAYPISKDAKIPLIDAGSDMGLFVKAAIKHQSKVPETKSSLRPIAATDYYTPEQIISKFTEVTGKKANYVQITAEVSKSFCPAPMADEMLDNRLFLESPGYYAGRSLEGSHALLDAKPTCWKDFVKSHIAEF